MHIYNSIKSLISGILLFQSKPISRNNFIQVCERETAQHSNPRSQPLKFSSQYEVLSHRIRTLPKGKQRSSFLSNWNVSSSFWNHCYRLNGGVKWCGWAPVEARKIPDPRTSPETSFTSQHSPGTQLWGVGVVATASGESKMLGVRTQTMHSPDFS